MPFKKPCLKCNQITTGGSYCDGCRPRKVDSPERKAKKQAMYGGDYRRRANAMKSSATHCHLCNKPFQYGDRVEADHLIPGNPNSPLAPAHRVCNQRRGDTPLT
jgi:hypothetical protein